MLSEDAFAHSLGVHHGTPEPIEIAFEPAMGRYVRERIWHPSQTIDERPDGRRGAATDGLERLGAAELDSRLWPVGASRSAGELAAQFVDELERTRRALSDSTSNSSHHNPERQVSRSGGSAGLSHGCEPGTNSLRIRASLASAPLLPSFHHEQPLPGTLGDTA